MKEVNADLYEFLNNHEVHIYIVDKKIESQVFIPFYDLEDFVKIAGSGWLDEGGADCKLQDGNICIDIVDLIESDGHLISSYSNCFEKDEWNQYREQILKMEE
ncbi:hypothetical protein G9F71_008620 [Clostridium sp. FP2]|uniref:hypothetical protein n=1 Tax=Clostridium sp. FP2 TaxID=2724481 RepID=UPI0013E8FBB8|nr:hypothetical protein [Clostridium sp. FP2]MBZ9622916.1 hypothetical protein [Clostridium sp. FP2]